jgi:hypothetical protein
VLLLRIHAAVPFAHGFPAIARCNAFIALHRDRCPPRT